MRSRLPHGLQFSQQGEVTRRGQLSFLFYYGRATSKGQDLGHRQLGQIGFTTGLTKVAATPPASYRANRIGSLPSRTAWIIIPLSRLPSLPRLGHSTPNAVHSISTAFLPTHAARPTTPIHAAADCSAPTWPSRAPPRN